MCYKINDVYVYKNVNFPLPTAHLVQSIIKIFLPTCTVATAVIALCSILLQFLDAICVPIPNTFCFN